MTKVGIRDKEYGATTGGIATAYTLSIPLFGALEDLKSFNVKFHLTNGLNATLNINGLGAKPLVDQNNTALATSLLDVDGIYVFAYNLTNDSLVFMNATTGGGGFADPMTTIGDMIYRNAGNVTDRLPLGSESRKLTSVGGIQQWSTHRLKGLTVTNAMSPYTGLSSPSTDDNEVFICDTSAGSVDILFDLYGETSGFGDDWKCVTIKRDGPNTVFISTAAAMNIDKMTNPTMVLATDQTSVTLWVGPVVGGFGNGYIISYVGNSIVYAFPNITIS